MHGQCNFCITKTRRILIQISLGLILSGFFGLGFGFFVMLLWNGLLPDIWGWKEITYWQGVGLVILSRLLFGSHGYHKAANTPKAEEQGDQYYEQWWEKEGVGSVERYSKKIARKEESSD
jgi:hypothetical protein